MNLFLYFFLVFIEHNISNSVNYVTSGITGRHAWSKLVSGKQTGLTQTTFRLLYKVKKKLFVFKICNCYL